MAFRTKASFIGIVGLLLAGTAFSQSYPTKAVRVIVPLSAGSSTDLVMRLLAPKLTEILRQPVVIENIPGAGGNRGADVVAKSQPDGYTLLLGTSSSHAINVTLYSKMPYDAVRDFVPITLVGYIPFVMMAHPSLKVKTIRELIILAKSKPGQISYASSGNGTSSHLGMEMFKTMTGTDIQHVPYKGTAQANTDLIGGQISLQIDAIPVSLPLVRSGKVNGLGVTSNKRVSIASELPPINETVPGFEFTAWIGFWAPAGTPKNVVNRINASVKQALNSPEIREKMASNGWEISTSSPEVFGEFIKKEITKWSAVVKTSGAKVD